MVRSIQEEVFIYERSAVSLGDTCPKWLSKLSPFIDEKFILRIGGCLRFADLPFESKCPALLPRSHRFTELLVTKIPLQHFHAGLNITLYLLQQNFWIASVCRSIRHYLSKWNRCLCTDPVSFTPTIRDLSVPRVSQIKLFSCVGVDFAGPFAVIPRKSRGSRSTKAFLFALLLKRSI